MTVQEFIEELEAGKSIMFDYNQKSFGVLGWPQDDIVLYDFANQDERKTYYTSEDALDNFFIDGQPLRAIIPKVKRTL